VYEHEGHETKLESALTAGVDNLWENLAKNMDACVKVVAQSITKWDATERSSRSRHFLESSRCRPVGDGISAALSHL
jgi:hypothetical protein